MYPEVFIFMQNRALIVRRFLKIVLVTIFAHKIFHKISKLDMWLSDRHAKFQVSAPVRARARRFLRFLLAVATADRPKIGAKIFQGSIYTYDPIFSESVFEEETKTMQNDCVLKISHCYYSFKTQELERTIATNFHDTNYVHTIIMQDEVTRQVCFVFSVIL